MPMTDAERLAEIRRHSVGIPGHWPTPTDMRWLLAQLDAVLDDLRDFRVGYDHDSGATNAHIQRSVTLAGGRHSPRCRVCVAAEQLARLLGETQR